MASWFDTISSYLGYGASTPPPVATARTPAQPSYVPPPVSAPAGFVPVAVEDPGGGRITNKKDPPVSDLVSVTGAGGTTYQLHKIAAAAWQAMVDAARAQGIASPLLLLTSGYRSTAKQQQLWDAALKRYGSAAEARKWVAPPGGSPHHSGRAVDLHLGGKNDSSNVANLRTLPAYKWLVANAVRFGFYPYEREPWHWEYNPPASATAQEDEWWSPTTWYDTARSYFGYGPSTPTTPTAPAYPVTPAPTTPTAPSAGIGTGWTAMTSTDERAGYVVRRLVSNYGYPTSGAAGLVGNVMAESGVIPSRIEGSSNATPTRAKDFSGTVRDFTPHEISDRNTTTKTGPLLPGVGLCQWTSSARRKGLFAHTYNGRTLGADILFDIDAQIDYLVTELRTQYASVDRVLRSAATSADAASDEVVYNFEMPATVWDQSTKPWKKRPRTDPSVQTEFANRRAYGQRALRAYQAQPAREYEYE